MSLLTRTPQRENKMSHRNQDIMNAAVDAAQARIRRNDEIANRRLQDSLDIIAKHQKTGPYGTYTDVRETPKFVPWQSRTVPVGGRK